MARGRRGKQRQGAGGDGGELPDRVCVAPGCDAKTGARSAFCTYHQTTAVGAAGARELHGEYVGPQVTGHDLLLDRAVTWTLGFQRDELDIGMGGAGGCSAWWSFTGRYAAAFVSRGLGTHDRSDAVYDWLEEHYAG